VFPGDERRIPPVRGHPGARRKRGQSRFSCVTGSCY